MTVQFPAIRPSERELTPAALPQTRVRTESRRTSRRALANEAGGPTVAFTFTNVTDGWAESIRQTHRLSKGTYDSLVLPPELWAGDPELEAFLAGAGAWRFAEPPRIEWQKRGRATVTVRLVQKRRDALPGFNPNAPPLLPWIPPTVPNPGPVPPLGPDGPDPPEPPFPPESGAFWLIQDDNMPWGDSGTPPVDDSDYDTSGMALRPGGGFVTAIGGRALQTDVGSIHLQAFNAAGGRDWRCTFNNGTSTLTLAPSIRGVTWARSAGGYATTAFIPSSSSTDRLEILRCDTNGGNPTVNSYTFDFGAGGTLEAAVEDPLGNTWIAVRANGFPQWSFIVKIAADMSVVAARRFDSTVNVQIYDLLPLNDGSGDVIFVGRRDVLALAGRLSFDMNNVIWAQTYGTSFGVVGTAATSSIRNAVLWEGGSSSFLVAGQFEYKDPLVIQRAFLYLARISASDGSFTSGRRIYAGNNYNQSTGLQARTGGYLLSSETYYGINENGSQAVIGLSNGLGIAWQFELASTTGPQYDSLSFVNAYKKSNIAATGDTIFLSGVFYYGATWEAPFTVSIPEADLVTGINISYSGFTSRRPWSKTTTAYSGRNTTFTSVAAAINIVSFAFTASTPAVYVAGGVDVGSLLMSPVVAPPPPPPPSRVGATPIIPASIVYSQSSVYPGNTAATVATMQNAISSETTATGTNNDSLAYILMDLGEKRLIDNIIIGSDLANTLAGGWGVNYSSELDIEYSEDGVNWFLLANTEAFTSPIKTIYGLNAAGRYIRLVSPGTYIAITEFYATTDAILPP